MRGDKEFRDLVAQIGNVFQAILISIRNGENVQADIRRRFHVTIPFRLAEQIALTGYTWSDVEFILTEVEKQQRKSDAIYDMLYYVDDEDVRKSVRKSVQCSKHRHNLSFQYRHNMSQSQRARVRILTRMIWDKFLDTRRNK